MPVDESCPCGAHIKSGYESVDYLTQALIDIVVDTATKRLKFGSLLASFLGITIAPYSICSSPRPARPDDFTLADFVVAFPLGQQKLNQWLAYQLYTAVCECDDCPPITSCDQGECYSVTSGDGYLADNKVQMRYHIPTGADLYIERSDGQCLGLKNGVWIYWNFSDDTLTDMTSVNVRDGNDNAPGDTWDPDTIGSGVGICAGGEQQPPIIPWPNAPDGVADYPLPPACNPVDICTALEYVYTATKRIEFLASVIAGPVWGVTAPVEIDVPGADAPIAGTIAEVLGRALTALAPIQATQLISATTTPITQTSVIDVSDRAYVNIDVASVPASVGSRGSAGSEVYYSNHRTPGPGWVVCAGQEGVLWHRELLYPGGLEFQVPSTATDLAIHLEPGVAITLTSWLRDV